MRGLRALAAVSMVAILSVTAASAQTADSPEERLNRNVFRELITLPYYGVFDHLAFKVDKGGMVTLLGSVRLPSLKRDAEARVRDITGVENVRNEIEVLPASPQDDRIRLQAYRAIYRHDVLERYALNAVPPIHIIVKNGSIMLEGRVGSDLDKQLAEFQARSVAGTFTITNNLEVEKTP